MSLLLVNYCSKIVTRIRFIQICNKTEIKAIGKAIYEIDISLFGIIHYDYLEFFRFDGNEIEIVKSKSS